MLHEDVNRVVERMRELEVKGRTVGGERGLRRSFTLIFQRFSGAVDLKINPGFHYREETLSEPMRLRAGPYVRRYPVHPR